jgi:hypothetical protein
VTAPAYYARSTGTGGLADWWTLLHPPYTAWHLSYVVIGAVLAPRVDYAALGATVAAFFLGMGVAAHALDELAGRPLRTGIPTAGLVAAAVAGLVAAVVVGVAVIGWVIAPFAAVGVTLVAAYNLELAGGVVHNIGGFAAAWGAFPVLTGYFAQDHAISPAALAAAAAAFALSWAQRRLSTPARDLRRRARSATAVVELADGTVRELDAVALRAPYEAALRALTWATVALAVTGLLARLAPHWS